MSDDRPVMKTWNLLVTVVDHDNTERYDAVVDAVSREEASREIVNRVMSGGRHVKQIELKR